MKHAALVLLLLPAVARAGQPLTTPVPRGGGVTLVIESVFENTPPLRGALPVRVRLRNTSTRAGVWELEFAAGAGYYGEQILTRRCAVEAGVERQFEIALPTTNQRGLWGSLRLRVRGPGFDGSQTHVFTGHFRAVRQSSGRNVDLPATEYVAFSRFLATANWEALKAFLDTQKTRGLYGGRFDPDQLSSDWRAYLGVGSLWMSDEEWRVLAPGPRQGLLRWVGLGGRVLLARETRAPDHTGGLHRDSAGLGSLRWVERQGTSLDVAEVAAEIVAHSPPPKSAGTSPPPVAWSLFDQIPAIELPTGMLAGILLAYAALVAPANLFLVCRGARRRRLFWTTPAFSLVTAGVLAAVIVLQDGIGGNGQRHTTIALVPARHEAYVLQEQAVKTGLVLNSSFHSPEPLWIELFHLAPLHARSNRGRHRLEQTDAVFWGDWLRSRTVQTHLVVAVRPSRSRVEWLATASPEILSTFPGRLAELVAMDAAGAAWMAHDVTPGRRTKLSRMGPAAFTSWWQTQRGFAGPRARVLLERVRSRPGTFFARSDDPATGVDTFADLRWGQKSLVVGPCVKQKQHP